MKNISAEELRKLIHTNDLGERVLDLRMRGLSKVPEAVTDLTELEELNLSGNYLKELPKGINKLKNLRRLRLDWNQLREPPHIICELSDLTVLSVSYNQLSVLPLSIKHLKKLRILDLSYNQLTTLPDEIGELKELKELDVSNNKLAVLSSHIKHLNKLRGLDLDDNQLTTLPDEIGELKELEWLYLAGNPLTLEGMRKVVKLQNKMKFFRDVTAHVVEQRAEGQRAQLAYEKALRAGFVNVYRGRILLIGQDRAGKTSLKKSLLGLPFDPKEQSTEGIEVEASTCQIEVEQVKNWHSTHENKPGLVECSKDISRIVAEELCDRRMEFREMGHSTTALEATAMTEEHFKAEEVEEIVDSEISSPSRKAKALSKQSFVINGEHFPDCGNEIELNEPDVTINATSPPDDITKHVHQWLKYVRGKRGESDDITKGESVVSMDVWDFAGQHLYYASHPLFLSSRALYILVHDLNKPLHAPAQPYLRQGIHILKNPNSETNLENLLSWLATIHSITQVKEKTDYGAELRLPYLRPPVLIVGTHGDKPSSQDIAEMKSEIQKRISGKEYGHHVILPLFSIDNTRSPMQNRIKRVFRQGPKGWKHQTDDIQELRIKIMEVLGQEPYMGEKIPVRWFLFEKVIEALIAKNIYHRHLLQLQNYAKKHCFIEDADEFAGMIRFYHDRGMIIKHRSTVVLKVQWLIDLLKQLITIPPFQKMDPLTSRYWSELERDGILCMELVDHVFSKFIQQGIIKHDILDMMERFGLIAKFSPSPSDVKYFVPAQLTSPPEELCTLEPSPIEPCPLYIHFVHGFVPHGLFLQLVSRSIHWCCKTWRLQHAKLYQNGAWFSIGKQIHDFIFICKKSFIKIILRQRMQSHQVSAEKSEELATQVREFIEGSLQSLSQELPYLSGLQYELCVACPYCHCQECPNHGKLSCEEEECFHLLEVKQAQPLICMRKVCDKVCMVQGLEKWLLKRTSQQIFQNLQQMQHDGSKVNSNTDLSAELMKIASAKDFVISDNDGSGNCMFYALSEQLNLVKGIKISPEELRQSTVQYLRKNPKLPDGTDLFNFIDGYRSWADYLTNMEQDGTWGDHVILYATANCYETYIHVISSQSDHHDPTIRPDHHVISTNPLVLGHLHELHYVSLQPKQVPLEIQARGPRAIRAYNKALRIGKVKVYRSRIMLIGQNRAGKTSLKKSLLGMPFDPEEQSTVGIEVDPSSFGVDVDQIKNWQRTDGNLGVSQFAQEIAFMVAKELDKEKAKKDLEAQDVSQGADNVKEVQDVTVENRSHTNQGADNVMEVQDVTVENRSHTNQVNVLIEDEKVSNKDSTTSLLPDKMEEAAIDKGPQLKIDPSLPPEECTQCLIEHLAGSNLLSDTTLKEPVVDLDLWDFAGQHLYYASHPVFLSRRAIYLLVCNLSKGLNDTAQFCVKQGMHEVRKEDPNGQTNLDDLLSWLVSVSAVCPSKQGLAEKEPLYLRPPVLIVGTHADKPFQDIEEMKLQIQKAISTKDYGRHVIPVMLSIDNRRSSSDAGVDELKREIMKVIKQEPYMGKEIPVRWFNFEKVVQALVAQERHYLNLKELQRIVEDSCFIEDKNEFDVMLDFYHDLGLIVRHGSTVVLKAQWLIDVFKQLITIPCFKDMEPTWRRRWERLEKEGVLPMDLVHHVFSKFTQPESITETDILGMMERFGLIAKFTSPTEESYFVPAQLRSPSSEDLRVKEFPSSNLCPLYVDFGSPLDDRLRSGFVPHGFFPQLVSRCIRWCSKKCFKSRPKLFQCAAKFFIGTPVTHNLILVCKKRFIKVILSQIKPDTELLSAQAEEVHVPSLVRRFLEDTLNDLKQELPWFSNLEYELRVACTLCPERICREHEKISCTHEDCLCLLEMVPAGEQFCHESEEYVTIHNLDKWFSQRTTLQDVSPSTTVAPSQDTSAQASEKPVRREAHSTSQCRDSVDSAATETALPRVAFKEGRLSDVELDNLAGKIYAKWTTLGCHLGISENVLEEIAANARDKAREMLIRWRHTSSSCTPYKDLYHALCHVRVGLDDVAKEFCCKDTT